MKISANNDKYTLDLAHKCPVQIIQKIQPFQYTNEYEVCVVCGVCNVYAARHQVLENGAHHLNFVERFCLLFFLFICFSQALFNSLVSLLEGEDVFVFCLHFHFHFLGHSQFW